MPRNFTVLDDLDEMLTAAGIEHYYTHGSHALTVFCGDHVWTVSEDCIIYWGDDTDDGTDVCKSRRHDTPWAADAYDYIADNYTKAQ